MWTLGAFQQLAMSNVANPQQHPQMAPPQMFTATNPAQTQSQPTTSSTMATVQQQGMISSPSLPNEVVTPPHNSPVHWGSVGDTGKETLEELEDNDPLVSALSFTTAPGNPQEPYFLCMFLTLLKSTFGQGNILI